MITHKIFKTVSLTLLATVCLNGTVSYSATPVNLRHQHLTNNLMAGPANVKEISRHVDANRTMHIRVQEVYQGYPVWGGDGVVHVKNGGMGNLPLSNLVQSNKNQISMNGTMYENLNKDLDSAPSFIFNANQAQKAMQHVMHDHQVASKATGNAKDVQTQLIVYIDENNKAHWAFHISFYVDSAVEQNMPERPNYIIDAANFEIYKKWDDIQTGKRHKKDKKGKKETHDKENGGGYGGNKKMGRVTYDGLDGDLPILNVSRSGGDKICYLQNEDVTVKHYSDNSVVTFPCDKTEENHNALYWDGELHAVNGGYSPDNDALYGGAMIKEMYQKWYNLPVLKDRSGKPMMLNMIVHKRMDNAYWDGRQMTFGDGVYMFYPLTSLGVAAHEISHGFTQQHSNMAYYGQSGAMNESFSDMAAQAAEFYAYGKNSWQIGPEIFKKENEALRYMDKPSKDCKGKTPGSWCSVDEMSQYSDRLDVHFGSGIYNRLFYLMGTATGWDTRKAFDVMIKANTDYWTQHVTFSEGACGILDAAKDLSYDQEPIKNALKVVGIKYSNC